MVEISLLGKAVKNSLLGLTRVFAESKMKVEETKIWLRKRRKNVVVNKIGNKGEREVENQESLPDFLSDEKEP